MLIGGKRYYLFLCDGSVIRCSRNQTIKALEQWAKGNDEYIPYGQNLGQIEFDGDFYTQKQAQQKLKEIRNDKGA